MRVKVWEPVTLEILWWIEVGDQIIGIDRRSVTPKLAPLLEERLNLSRIVEEHDYSIDVRFDAHQDALEIPFLKGDSLGRDNRVRET
jgi:hypothetical protein